MTFKDSRIIVCSWDLITFCVDLRTRKDSEQVRGGGGSARLAPAATSGCGVLLKAEGVSGVETPCIPRWDWRALGTRQGHARFPGEENQGPPNAGLVEVTRGDDRDAQRCTFGKPGSGRTRAGRSRLSSTPGGSPSSTPAFMASAVKS